MSAQQIASPSRPIRALVIVALLLVALAVGAVTAVNLFPARASVQAQAANESTSLNAFRAGERDSLSRSAIDGGVVRARARAQAFELRRQAAESASLIEFRAGERASLTQAGGQLVPLRR
jgi:hypothetical protein